MGRLLLVCFVFVCSRSFMQTNANIQIHNTHHDEYTTTGRHLIVMKPWQRASNEVPKPLRQLGDIAQTMRESYNISVLRQIKIGHWMALLVDMGDIGVTSLSAGVDNDDIDYIEPELRVTTFAKIQDRVNEIIVLKSPLKSEDSTGNPNEIQKDDNPNDTSQETTADVPDQHKFISEVKVITRENSWSRDVVNQNQTTPDPAVCYQQLPSAEIWALPRISHHTKPEYSSSPYLFTSIDQGAGVQAYIVDTGVRITHSEFKGKAEHGYVAAGMDEGPEDGNGHGTHVASLVAGDLVGVAKQASVVSVKVLNTDGYGDVSWILEGLEWISDTIAAQRADGKEPKAVINLSLGVAGISYTLDHAVQAMVEDVGVPVVAAAGNNNDDACQFSPARVSSVITVAATNDKDKLASFSNYGPCVNMLSPGDVILGAYGTGDDTYALISGTSQATPLVTGVITRYLSSLEGAPPTPTFIKAYMEDTASIDYIQFISDIQSTTPNRLVYRACESMGPDLPEYRPTFPINKNVSGSANMTIFYLVPIVNFSVLFVALLLLISGSLPCLS